MTRTRYIADLHGVMALMGETPQQDSVAIIGVCGFAGAGKSTLCNRITASMPGFAFHLECDRFSAFSYPERRKRIELATGLEDSTRLAAEQNPLNWYDWEGISTAIRSLRGMRGFETRRAWNSQTGLLDATYGLSLPSSGPAVVLCDCIFLLHEPIRRWFDLTLLVESDVNAIHERRKRRAGDQADIAKARQDGFERPYFEEFGILADRIVDPLAGA